MASLEIAAMQMALESSLIMDTIFTLMMPKVVIYSAVGKSICSGLMLNGMDRIQSFEKSWDVIR